MAGPFLRRLFAHGRCGSTVTLQVSVTSGSVGSRSLTVSEPSHMDYTIQERVRAPLAGWQVARRRSTAVTHDVDAYVTARSASNA
jgi:hypothetical protein